MRARSWKENMPVQYPQYPRTKLFSYSIASNAQREPKLGTNGKKSCGLFLNSASPVVAEQMAHVGYDWLLVDCQHSQVTHSNLSAMLGAIRSNNTPAYVRVPSPDDRPSIQQALDLGASAIMIPTIRTASDAQRAIDAAYFPPLGSRSIAFPIRPQLGKDVEEYLIGANHEVSVILQIETRECLHNLEEILSVTGVDGVFVGPFDLSFDLGFLDKYGYPDGMKSEEFRDVLSSIVEVCKQHDGIVPGCFASPAAGPNELLDMGFDLIGTGTDLALLGAAASKDIERTRSC